jgi:hypothetical protein
MCSLRQMTRYLATSFKACPLPTQPCHVDMQVCHSTMGVHVQAARPRKSSPSFVTDGRSDFVDSPGATREHLVSLCPVA